MRRTHQKLIGTLLATAALCALPTAASGASQGAVVNNAWVALWGAVLAPNISPMGANDWACKPTAAHPRPVILLHGTYQNMYSSFANLSRPIKRQGYCVFAYNYGSYPQGLGIGIFPAIKGIASVRSSARQVSAFVEKVRRETGAAQVDLVGYSQGGVVARAYLKYDGGANPSDPTLNKVKNVVGIASTNRGSSVLALTSILRYFGITKKAHDYLGPSSRDLRGDSPFLTDLNAGGDTMPGVNYTMIGTMTDIVSVPYTGAFLNAGPGSTVRNITLQQGCPTDLSGHFTLPYTPRTHGLVLQALDPTYAGHVPCPVRVPDL